MSGTFDVTLPLEKASCLSAEFYTDSEVLKAELEKVFYQSWNFVGRASQIHEPGSWITTQVGKVPLVLTRDMQGKIHCLLNVCRHRAARVCRGQSGKGTRLKCQYHGWSYDLQGQLMTTPEFQGVEDFHRNENGLPRFEVNQIGDWLFTTLVQSPIDFNKQWAPFRELAAPFQLEKMQFWKRVEYPLACNWKVFVDNYLDGGYHINTLHPSLAGVIPYSEYQCHLFEHSSLQTAPLRQKGSESAVSQVRKGTAQYWWIYPNLMINLYDGVMDLNLVLPDGPHRCKVLFDFYFSDTSESQLPLIEESLGVAHQVQMEDQEICEEVQSGLESGYFKQGRFSVSREKTAFHFHQLLASTLRASK